MCWIYYYASALVYSPAAEQFSCKRLFINSSHFSRGALFGILRGSSRTVLNRFSEVLPNKHGRGGQSANRFSRLQQEARHNYVRKVAEAARAAFVSQQTGEVEVAGLVLAGSADLKTVLGQSGMFDRRLKVQQ